MNYKHLHYFWAVAKAGGVLRASEQLNLTPQTVSGQIQLLEEAMGRSLFRKSGRHLELTDAGQLALTYAEEIFSLGAEMEHSLRNIEKNRRSMEFRVGVADAVPKSIVYRLLEPAMNLPEPVHLICREWKLDSLLSELALHRLDLVIADVPIPPALSVRAYNHRLGQSGSSFYATRALRKSLVKSFPECLDDAPLLLPSAEIPVGKRLSAWLDKHKLRPRIVGEFDDTALMKAFGQNSKGIFIAPTALEEEICAQYNVSVLGRVEEIKSEFYAISVERRIMHPCVIAITQAARDTLFSA